MTGARETDTLGGARRPLVGFSLALSAINNSTLGSVLLRHSRRSSSQRRQSSQRNRRTTMIIMTIKINMRLRYRQSNMILKTKRRSRKLRRILPSPMRNRSNYHSSNELRSKSRSLRRSTKLKTTIRRNNFIRVAQSTTRVLNSRRSRRTMTRRPQRNRKRRHVKRARLFRSSMLKRRRSLEESRRDRSSTTRPRIYTLRFRAKGHMNYRRKTRSNTYRQRRHSSSAIRYGTPRQSTHGTLPTKSMIHRHIPLFQSRKPYVIRRDVIKLRKTRRRPRRQVRRSRTRRTKRGVRRCQLCFKAFLAGRFLSSLAFMISPDLLTLRRSRNRGTSRNSRGPYRYTKMTRIRIYGYQTMRMRRVNRNTIRKTTINSGMTFNGCPRTNSSLLSRIGRSNKNRRKRNSLPRLLRFKHAIRQDKLMRKSKSLLRTKRGRRRAKTRLPRTRRRSSRRNNLKITRRKMPLLGTGNKGRTRRRTLITGRLLPRRKSNSKTTRSKKSMMRRPMGNRTRILFIRRNNRRRNGNGTRQRRSGSMRRNSYRDLTRRLVYNGSNSMVLRTCPIKYKRRIMVHGKVMSKRNDQSSVRGSRTRRPQNRRRVTRFNVVTRVVLFRHGDFYIKRDRASLCRWYSSCASPFKENNDTSTLAREIAFPGGQRKSFKTAPPTRVG